MSGYSQTAAETYNRLLAQGVPPVQAAQQAGIPYLQLVNSQRYEGDGRGPINNSYYRLGSNGQIGPRDPQPPPPPPNEVTVQDPVTVETTRETVTVPVSTVEPTPTVGEQLVTRANRAEEESFIRNAYPQQATQGAGPTRTSEYTTTSTEQVSGGGVTTVVRDPGTATPRSAELDAQSNRTLREIEELQLANSGLGPGPALTEAQMQANDARILELSQRYENERSAAQAARTPGEPSVTTQPNTTTTTRTTVYENTSENIPQGQDPNLAAQSAAAQPNVPAADVVPAAPPASQDQAAAGNGTTEDPRAAGENVGGVIQQPAPAIDPYAVDGEGLGDAITADPFITNALEEPPVVGRNVTTAFNPETGLYDVVDLDSGEVLAQDRTELEAQIDAAELEAGDLGAPVEDDVNEAFLPESDLIREPTEQDAQEYGNNPNAPGSAADAINRQIDSPDNTGERERDTLKAAQNIRELRQQSTGDAPGDWRVRLRLAPLSNYLYNDPDNTLLKPLAATDGVIFPYTPQISTVYHANYNQYDLTHSNYRGYFYQNSYVGEVQIQAAFTAQDTKEAEYLLAVIHFFRSATKMFYGGGNGKPDEQIGSPPPLVFLSGLGDYQFAEHPCVIAQFNYNLPSDVDYLRVASPSIVDTNLQNRRADKSATTPTGIGSILSLAGLSRLAGIGASPGGARPITVFNPGNLSLINGSGAPTYVPSKIDVNLVLLPMQSRKAASQQASLRDYAAGNLLKGGFW